MMRSTSCEYCTKVPVNVGKLLIAFRSFAFIQGNIGKYCPGLCDWPRILRCYC